MEGAKPQATGSEDAGSDGGPAPAEAVAAEFIKSAEFVTLYGAQPSNADLLTHIYQNVLHRAPDASGYAFWLGVLDRNAVSRAQVLAEFSESPENQAALIGVIGNGFSYQPYTG